jgi:hypothetical protein
LTSLPQPDPLIAWPANFSLESSLASLQELNPALNLRRAVDSEDGETEYLFYEGSALDVFEITLPEPASDDLVSSLTDVNRESWTISTDLGSRRYGPHRLERTSRGDILVRPRSTRVDEAAATFGIAHSVTQWLAPEAVGRVTSRWGVRADKHELWEIEFAYLPANWLERPIEDELWWSTIAVGTIAFIDEYDLPMEAHDARAWAIVATGSEFAIVGDLERLEYRIYRRNGMSIERAEFTLPEMPWFSFPRLR